MPLHPAAKAMLDEIAVAGLPPLETLSPEEARAQDDPTAGLTPVEPVASVEDRTIPGPAGLIPVRIYYPEGRGPFPLLLYFHGGGWVLGSLDTADGVCRTLTNLTQSVTVSVGYRLAPEHPFPAAVEDCYAATVWAADHAIELGADPRRIVVAGSSAGGNLAAAIALLARAHSKPRIAAQLLICPVLDRPDTTPSYRENAEGYDLTRAEMFWFWNHYMPDKTWEDDPRAAPLQAAELSGLPPAVIMTAEYDPLRDEGKLYADRLRDAGVPVYLKRCDGMIHSLIDVPEEGRAALADATIRLREALGQVEGE